MLQNILLALQIIVCVSLVAVILLQRSEGGALGMGGGGGGGLMTARGAGNLLTRTTAMLAGAFFLISVTLTILGNIERHSTLANKVGSAPNAAGLMAAKPSLAAQAAAAAAAAKTGQPQPQAPANSLGELETGGPVNLTVKGGAPIGGIPLTAPGGPAPAGKSATPAPKSTAPRP